MSGPDLDNQSIRSSRKDTHCGRNPAATSSLHPRAHALRYEPIELSNGWSARVLIECHELTPEPAAPSITGIRGLEADGARRFHGFPTTQHWRTLLERVIEAPAELADYVLLKYSNTGEVFRATLDWPQGSLPIVAKQSRARGWMQRILGRAKFYLAPQTLRARRGFQRALRLFDAGIETAIPLALIERRGADQAAWLVSQYVDGLVDLDHVALSLLPRIDDARQRAMRNQLIERVATLLVRLEHGGWYHRDLKATNILLTDWHEPTARVWLLDLDGLRRRRPWEWVPDVRPLVRLAASLLDHSAITRADFARFLRQYLVMSSGSHVGWKAAFHDIAKRARHYKRRASIRRNTRYGEVSD